MTNRNPWLCLAALASLGLPGAVWASNGPAPPSIGAKGPVALPAEGDALTMHRMPSSIGWALEHRFDLDLFYFYSETAVRNVLNDFNNQGPTFGGTFGVYFAPGRPDLDDDDNEVWDSYSDAGKFTIGTGFFIDLAGGGEKVGIRYTTFPNTIGVTQGLTFLTNTWSAAFTPTENLSLGVALHFTHGSLKLRTLVGGDGTPLNGSPTIQGVPLPGNPSYSDFLDLFSNDATTDPTTLFKGDLSGFQFGATLSVSFKPLENLALGFSYRFKSFGTKYTGDGQILADRTFEQALNGLSPGLQSLFLSTLPDGGQFGFTGDYDVELEGITVPRQARLSIAFWPTERLMIAADVAWIDWHDSFRTAELVLSDGSNNDLNFVTGSSTINSEQSSRWHNQWVVSLATAFALTDQITLRAGFNWGRVPFNVDKFEGGSNSGIVTTQVSFGGGFRPVEALEINLMVEHAFHHSERSNLEPDFPTADNSFYSAKQWFIHVGVGVNF